MSCSSGEESTQSSSEEEAVLLETSGETFNWIDLLAEAHKELNPQLKLQKVRLVLKKFESSAKRYGQTIIFEANMSEKQKTVKPVALGGIAGGDKVMRFRFQFGIF
jgi:hypothetical protein